MLSALLVASFFAFIPLGSCDSDWTSTLTASIGGKSSATVFGVNSAASTAFDAAFDQVLEVAPPRGTEYLESCFYHQSEPSIVRYLTHSVVDPAEFSWVYQVESYELAGTIALSWIQPSLPSGYTLVLKDSAGSVFGDMSDVSTYNFTAQQNTLYTFKIVYAKTSSGSGAGDPTSEPSSSSYPYWTVPPTFTPYPTDGSNSLTASPTPEYGRFIPGVPNIVVYGGVIIVVGLLIYLAAGRKRRQRRR